MIERKRRAHYNSLEEEQWKEEKKKRKMDDRNSFKNTMTQLRLCKGSEEKRIIEKNGMYYNVFEKE